MRRLPQHQQLVRLMRMRARSPGDALALYTLLAWVIVLVLLLFPFDVEAATNIVTRVTSKSERGGVRIRVLFSEPMLYVGHQPRSSTRRLTIRLRPQARLSTASQRYVGKQSLRQTPTPAVPLTNVLYTNPEGREAKLILEFSRPVIFKVTGERNGEAVVVTLPSLVIKGEAPDPVAPGDDDVLLDGHYVVNLHSSDRPVTVWTVPRHDLFARYRLYTRKTRVDGKTYERLRLGFFVDKEAAQDAVEELREHFPGAWVAKVPQREKILSARSIVRVSPQADQVAVPSRQSSVTSETQDTDVGLYTLNLLSGTRPFSAKDVEGVSAAPPQRLYTVAARRGDVVRHRLRLGFFPSIADAREYAQSLRERFPTLQIVRATELERKESALNLSEPQPEPKPVRAQTAKTKKPVVAQKLPKRPDTKRTSAEDGTVSKADKLLQLSRDALTSGDYASAIGLLTKLLQTQGHQHDQQAQELLGFARERNGQLAHAKAEYEKYLQLYGNTEDAARVRQRLAGLVTAAKAPTASATSESEEVGEPWTFFGNVSQYYWYDTDFVDNEEEVVNVSELTSFGLLNARKRAGRFDVRTQLSFDDKRDFLEDDDDTRVLDAWVDLNDRRHRYFARLGRQSSRSDGVLGRFDGINAGYELTEVINMNVVAGVPVDSFDSDLETDKQFIGTSVDYAISDSFEVGAYLIEQTADGLLDRRAAGGEMRYFTPTHSVIGLLDYDLYYDRTNILFGSGTWALSPGNTLYGSLDQRSSPLLSTSVALQSQPFVSLDEMNDVFSTSQIEDIALDRIADVTTLSLGYSAELRSDLQGAADFTYSEATGTRPSAGVAAMPATDMAYYSVKLIKNAWLRDNDVTVTGLRYSEGDAAELYSLFVNYRLPLNGWRVSPRFQIDHRRADSGNQRNTARASFRADYRHGRRLRFNLEFGLDVSDEEIDDVEQGNTRYYGTVGYSWDF